MSQWAVPNDGFLAKPPPILGYFVLATGGSWNKVKLTMYRKPSWVARTAMRLIFEITWEDV